ncbi:hypothetical protein GGF38_005738, partial [Coemansia sp. RSA 25]
MSQFTSVVLPLVRSYRQSDIFTWSDSSGRNASKELFYRVLNHPEMFRLLKVYSAANFCTEVTLFLEEYQVLKANAVRFYNMDEPDFKVDETGATKLHAADDDDNNDGGPTTSAATAAAAISRPDFAATCGHNNSIAWAAANTNSSYCHPYAVAGAASSHSPEIMDAAHFYSEKDALRLHLNGKHGDLESNPDTVITVGDGCSVSEAEYSDKAAIVPRPGDIGTSSALRIHAVPAHPAAAATTTSNVNAGAKNKLRLGGLWGMFQKNKSGSSSNSSSNGGATADTAAGAVSNEDIECGGGGGDNGLIKPSNAAILAIGGAAIGDLPQRRNSRGEEVMIVSSIPPFTPVRYTIMPTLMQTPAGLHRK